MKKDLLPLAIEYPWLKEVDSCCIRTALEDLERVYLNFYSGGGHPNYKKRKNPYRTNCIRSTYQDKEYSNISIDIKDKEKKVR